MSQYGFDAQLRMYTQSLQGKSHWEWPVSLDDWRQSAKERLTAQAWGYVEGGAGLEDTMAENRRAFGRYLIRSRMLNNVADRDLSVDILGQTYDVPFMLAPLGVQSIIYRDGELASAKAAADAGVPYILSTVSSVTMETVAEAMGSATRWFQLYPGRDPNIIQSFLDRAERAGYSGWWSRSTRRCSGGGRRT
ncbi:alpha-hydroxy-acid oxidizing protein [Alicyclobacillus dauci]|uniref:Alpha-hydroxy-acid oxidizing protein n=1 Tax=Alicyclobacillus dauci TaxID=1475485 RepID=A0ABY6Z0X3_9BACL|nr:alpha-hydroxy-acid oxidizing protein [Alicyclobacillus dauci]WAH36183.1 alpha-hydroxy-acid oxidizing protein [Alicyclobacillus dauci]